MSSTLEQYRQWVVENFVQIKMAEDYATMSSTLLMSGIGLPNAEAFGEAAAALIRIMKMVNDRIWALHKHALTVYPTDNLRLAVSALAKLSLSIEIFASEAAQTRTVVFVEAARALLRSILLAANGLDVLIHGGEPDSLTVQLTPPPAPSSSSPSSGKGGDDEMPPPTVTIHGGDDVDSSKGRPLWWRGAESGRWLSMSADAPGADPTSCRQAHLPAVWQVVASEVLLVFRPLVEAVLMHVKPGKNRWFSTLAAFLMDAASVQLLSQAHEKFGKRTATTKVVASEIWRRKMAFKTYFFRQPIFALVLGTLVRKIQAGFDYVPLLRVVVRFLVGILFYWQKYYYWAVPP